MKAANRRPFFSWIEAGIGLLILSGIIFTVFCDKEWKIISHSHTPPQSITAAKLAADGPGSNWYVHITDFTMVEPMVSYVKQTWPMGDSMQSLSCKLVPQPVTTDHANELILVKAAKTNAEIEAFLHQPAIDGIAESSADGMIKITARSPRSQSEFLLAFVLPAALCFVAGCVSLVIGWRRKAKNP